MSLERLHDYDNAFDGPIIGQHPGQPTGRLHVRIIAGRQGRIPNRHGGGANPDPAPLRHRVREIARAARQTATVRY